MKRTIVVLLGFIVVLVIPLVAFAAATFGGLAPLHDESLGDVGEVVADGFVAVGIVDVGDHHVALVDAGGDPLGKAVLAALTRRGLKPEDVQAIFLTHGHPDHVGGAHLFPNAKIYVLAAEIPYMTGQTKYSGPLPHLMGVTDPGIHPTPIDAGELIQVGSRTFEVFALPGHTMGSAAFLVSGVLFVGDAASLESDGNLRSAPWVFSDDVTLDRSSLQLLARAMAQRKVERIVFGHTGVATGSAALAALR